MNKMWEAVYMGTWMQYWNFQNLVDAAERVLSVNSERLIMQMADRLAEDGYRDAGYKYVSIDVSSMASRNLVLFGLWS